MGRPKATLTEGDCRSLSLIAYRERICWRHQQTRLFSIEREQTLTPRRWL